MVSIFKFHFPFLDERDDDYENMSGQKAVAVYDYQGGRKETSPRPYILTKYMSSQPQDRVFSFFSTEAADEISFDVDDVITNIEMVDEGWWKGQCHGRIGLFPAAYVELM